MTTSYTFSETFTRSSARYVASKVAADLRLLQRFYGRPAGRPTDTEIDDYTGELVELLLGGYVQRITYGFKRSGAWVVALRYDAHMDGTLTADDRAGRVIPGIDITGVSWCSFLVYSYAWDLLDPADRARIKARLPVERTGADEPSSSNGAWVQDCSYSAVGSGVQRASFRPW